MKRIALSIGLTLALFTMGCAKKGDPEQVADAFVDAYFVQVDQEKAKEFTALGATKMLEDELREVREVRKETNNPTEARGEMSIQRGEPQPREQRTSIPYKITLDNNGVTTVREADIELTQVQGSWKVVLVRLRSAKP